jgi:hypothetical protein
MNPMKHNPKPIDDEVWNTFFGLCGDAGGEAFTTQVQQTLGMRALAHLTHRMENRDPRAAKEIADRCLGVPVPSLPEQAQTMTPEQVREVMMARYRAAWPWHDDAEIVRMVDAVVARG